MQSIDQARELKTDIEVIIQINNEVINGKINIDANLGLGYFFNDDISKMKFLPVYDSLKQGVGGKTLILNKKRVDWISPCEGSDPSRDCVLTGGYNPITVTVSLANSLFVGELNLGYYKRLSDRLNDLSNHFIPLLNVEFRGIKRTIFINIDAIHSVCDEIQREEDEFLGEEFDDFN
jgi:hypothetical protein